jgi:hypothetical protein
VLDISQQRALRDRLFLLMTFDHEECLLGDRLVYLTRQ